MAKTRSELQRAILGKLNVVGVGETPAAEDTSKVDEHIATTVAQLVATRILHSVDLNAIPESIFDQLATHAAASAGPDFGQARNPDAQRQAEMEIARQRVARSSEPATPDYF